MTSVLFGMSRRATSETLPMHASHEFFAGAGSVNVHSNWVSSRGSKGSADVGWKGLRRGGPCYSSGALPLSLPFSLMLTNTNVKVGGDLNQLVEAHDGAGGMN